MKYCSYCGAVLVDGAVSFCAECGKALPAAAREKEADAPTQTYPPPGKASPKRSEPPGKPKKKNRGPGTTNQDRQPSPEPEKQEDGYDGYYDDVRPADEDRVKEGIDKELIKKIIAVAGIMLLIVGLCVAAMYLL